MLDYILDYTDLYDMHERDQERRLRRHPKCEKCKERITDEHFFNIDGTFICGECLGDYISENFKVNTDDYLEE